MANEVLTVPLLFATIILPLVIGPSIRWLLQTYYTVRRFWRFFIFPLVPAYLACYYKFSNNRPVNILLIQVRDNTVLGIAVVGAYRDLREGNRNIAWRLFMLFTLLCTLLENLVAKPFLMGTRILPWLILNVNLSMTQW